MRKPWPVLIVMVCALIVLPVALGACGGSGGGGDEQAILGVWTDSQQAMEYEFKADGVMLIKFMGEEVETKYELKDGKLSVTDPEAGETTAVEYKLEGDSLTLTFEGETETLTRKKD